ncbi:MAG: hypothetical protein AMXMBFR7_50080 [Planctomycetota bacterium]
MYSLRQKLGAERTCIRICVAVFLALSLDVQSSWGQTEASRTPAKPLTIHAPQEYAALQGKMAADSYAAWLARAEKGELVAIEVVALANLLGSPGKFDFAIARVWLEKGVEQGSALAVLFSAVLSQRDGWNQGPEQATRVALLPSLDGLLRPHVTKSGFLAYALGLCSELQRKYPEAMAQFQAAEKLGCFWACTEQGALIVNRRLGEPDRAKAKSLFIRAEEAGCLRAAAYLGGMATRERNPADVMKYLTKAAEGGYPEAQYWMARRFYAARDFPAVQTWMEAAAKQGFVPAMVEQGKNLHSGIYGKKDPKEAFSWYEKASQRGTAFGGFYAALALLMGDGVEKNVPRAVDIIKAQVVAYPYDDAPLRAAGLLLLGDVYAGAYDPTSKDEAKAKEYQELAQKDRGVNFAHFHLGQSYGRGWGVTKNVKEAVRWYSRGVEAGDPGCQYKLARCYENGWSVPKDAAKAEELYAKAAEKGWVKDGPQAARADVQPVVPPRPPTEEMDF